MSMRKTLFSIATALLCFTGCTSVPKTCEQPYEPIQIAVPERPAGQQDAVGLTAPKIDTVRVGFIGVGMRGISAVERWTHIPGVQIKALCDLRPDWWKRHKRRWSVPVCQKLRLTQVRKMLGNNYATVTTLTLFML